MSINSMGAELSTGDLYQYQHHLSPMVNDNSSWQISPLWPGQHTHTIQYGLQMDDPTELILMLAEKVLPYLKGADSERMLKLMIDLGYLPIISEEPFEDKHLGDELFDL